MPRRAPRTQQALNPSQTKREWWALLAKALILGLLVALRFQGPEYFPQLAPYFRFLTAFVVWLGGFVAVEFVRVSTLRLYIRRHSDNLAQLNQNFILGLRQISRILKAAIAVVALLLLFDLNFSRVVYSVSILAAGIAILTKDYVYNVFNGLIIMFTNSISIDDYIQVGPTRGRVTDLDLMNLRLVDEDGDTILVPNNTLVNRNLTNYTKRYEERVSLRFEIRNEQVPSLQALEDHLTAGLEDYRDRLRPEYFRLDVVEVRADTVVLKFKCSLRHRNRALEETLRKKLVQQVLAYKSTESQRNIRQNLEN